MGISTKPGVTLLAALALASALGPSAQVTAHQFSPGFLGLTELAEGSFVARWKVSISGGLADTLSPRLPQMCSFAGPTSTFYIGDALVQQRGLACDGGLAGGEIAITGLPSTMTDVLLRIDYLNGSSYTHLLTPAAPSVTVPRAQGTLAVMGTYLLLGIEHILLGIDHLLFVLALLLLVRDVRRLIVTVTAFTVAHSLTLAGATLGFVHVPQAPVEAVIALSILFLASELGRQFIAVERRRDLAIQFPWIVAFLFGLLHGFGFAGALAEIGLPTQAVPLALLFFNLGVEAGQLIFIVGVLSLAWAWRRIRAPVPPSWRLITAYGLGSTSAFWVIERTLAAL